MMRLEPQSITNYLLSSKQCQVGTNNNEANIIHD